MVLLPGVAIVFQVRWTRKCGGDPTVLDASLASLALERRGEGHRAGGPRVVRWAWAALRLPRLASWKNKPVQASVSGALEATKVPPFI